MTATRRAAFVSALIAATVTASFAQPVSAQLNGRPVCGDGNHGATIVGRIPDQPSSGGTQSVLVYPTGQVGLDYVDALAAPASQTKVTTIEQLQAMEVRQQRLAMALPSFYATARVAQPDSGGSFVCGDLPPGRYDVLVIEVITATNPGVPMKNRYRIAHARVPQRRGTSRLLIPISAFADITPNR